MHTSLPGNTCGTQRHSTHDVIRRILYWRVVNCKHRTWEGMGCVLFFQLQMRHAHAPLFVSVPKRNAPLFAEPVIFATLILIGIALGVALSCATTPRTPRDVPMSTLPSNVQVADVDQYLTKVYGNPTLSPQIVGVDPPLQADGGPTPSPFLNFLWDNLPQELRDTNPIASNTGFRWPPAWGERTRVVAYPYPKGLKHGSFTSNLVKMIRLLTNSSSDVATFPGWLRSIYDPQNPNQNAYRKILAFQLRMTTTGIREPIKNANGSASLQDVYLEVSHACYAPPTEKGGYPVCDDGAFWLYLTPGSGVFWNAATPQGKVLLANNKLHALYIMLTVEGRLNKHDAIDYIVKKWRSAEGNANLIIAIGEAVREYDRSGGSGAPTPPKGKQSSVLLAAFRMMRRSNANSTWTMWLVYTMTTAFVIIATLLVTIISIARCARRERTVASALGIISASIGVSILMSVIFYYYATNCMLEGFGWVTLKRALELTRMDLTQFVKNAIGEEGGEPDMIANGACITQVFDEDLVYNMLTHKIDVCFMHAQPNKGGVWAVEIIDVRQFRSASTNAPSFGLGLCGYKLQTKSATCSPPTVITQGPNYSLMRGPIHSVSPSYYGPTLDCCCLEVANGESESAFRDGKLRKCINCSPTPHHNFISLSHELC